MAAIDASAAKTTSFFKSAPFCRAQRRDTFDFVARQSAPSQRVCQGVAAWTIFVEFAVNPYALPFLVEAAVLFDVIAFVGMKAVMESGLTSTNPAGRELIEIVLG